MDTEPGMGMFWWAITSMVPNRFCRAAMSEARLRSEPGRVMMRVGRSEDRVGVEIEGVRRHSEADGRGRDGDHQ